MLRPFHTCPRSSLPCHGDCVECASFAARNASTFVLSRRFGVRFLASVFLIRPSLVAFPCVSRACYSELLFYLTRHGSRFLPCGLLVSSCIRCFFATGHFHLVCHSRQLPNFMDASWFSRRQWESLSSVLHACWPRNDHRQPSRPEHRPTEGDAARCCSLAFHLCSDI